MVYHHALPIGLYLNFSFALPLIQNSRR